MKAPITQREIAELPPRMRQAFGPLDKLALGLAFGSIPLAVALARSRAPSSPIRALALARATPPAGGRT